MSCWVAPSVAAEIWRMPLNEVMKRIQDGHIPSKEEAGFLFVDIAPHSPTIAPPVRKPSQRPPTYITITPAEHAALTAELPSTAAPSLPGVTSTPTTSPEAFDPENWRHQRRRAGSLRRAPGRLAA